MNRFIIGLSWRSVTLILLMLLAGCHTRERYIDEGDYQLDVSSTAISRSDRVRFLVFHYTAEDFGASLKILTTGQVSAHYLVPAHPPQVSRKPVAWRLVPESQSAWHAGTSYWRGYTQLNGTSIGIEQENLGLQQTASGTGGWQPYTPQQISLVTHLARDIIARHHIAPQYVVGHSDIAPQRKLDPGPLFPWQQLAQEGIGAWPDAQRVRFYLANRQEYDPVDKNALLEKLACYGYEVTPGMSDIQQQRVVAAFQMHFRQQRYNGEADAETEAIVDALLEKYGAMASCKETPVMDNNHSTFG
ncbi:N-acetylmuramoyl-L-alanine amidase [Dickeya poaceiphila]|uniref:N-acetylmuramoyl-L-alanine amidase n=1 Tax=Dickeya poaceiphila TaxID=568768 RepID=A0A5B8I7D2_9GAMM|nr:N-acetylmuramoyl-L-alanine amidase [Dickeya poaceiphila]QDX30283.1 N-acetylmuramoyl-L-alanine amidase [Dickeya poaceiphila]